MSNYFEIGIRYRKALENGMVKIVTESYMVDALSFTEAEARIINKMQPYMGDVLVNTIKRSNISDIVIDKTGVISSDDKWYKAKLNFIVANEKTMNEKKTAVYLLVNAGSVNAAHDVIVNHMMSSVQDY